MKKKVSYTEENKVIEKQISKNENKENRTVIKSLKWIACLTVGVGVGVLLKYLQNENNYNVSEDTSIDCFPVCSCGAKMTEYDGNAWYTCPICGDAVRDNEDGSWSWKDELFKEGTKENYSDFELANFCRGGDLTED